MKVKYEGSNVCTTVGIVFIILKLCGILDWSWLWVLSPFWIPVSIVLVLVFTMLFALTIGIAIKYIKDKI